MRVECDGDGRDRTISNVPGLFAVGGVIADLSLVSSPLTEVRTRLISR